MRQISDVFLFADHEINYSSTVVFLFTNFLHILSLLFFFDDDGDDGGRIVAYADLNCVDYWYYGIQHLHYLV